MAARRVHRAERLILDEHRTGLLVDIGCGSYPYFLERTDFHKKIGLDRVAAGIGRGPDNITLLDYDIEIGRVPLPDGSVSVATMLAVYEHLEPDRLAPVLKDIHRLLRPGGALILTTPAPWTDGLLRSMAAVGLVSAEEIEEHQGAYGPRSIRKSLEEAGFDPRGIRTGYFELFLNVWARAMK